VNHRNLFVAVHRKIEGVLAEKVSFSRFVISAIERSRESEKFPTFCMCKLSIRTFGTKVSKKKVRLNNVKIKPVECILNTDVYGTVLPSLNFFSVHKFVLSIKRFFS
jgi:hypothetical protein